MRPIAETGPGPLADRVFNEIEQAILDGSLSPGENLTELRLSAELGVSRTPVREALRQLDLEGLIRNVPNKGAVVVGISEQDIADIYDIRISLEGLAARRAAVNATEEEISHMRTLLELQEFFSGKNDAVQVRQLDSSFHASIYDSCRSRTLRHTLAQFGNYVRRARELSVRTEGRSAASVAEHRRILEAISARDGDAAEAAAREHLQNAKQSVTANV